MAEIKIDVAVQKVVGQSDAASDALMTLVQEIAKYLPTVNLSATEAEWVGTASEPIFDPENMREAGLFLSVLTLTYRTVL
jgi:hypothetical protein